MIPRLTGSWPENSSSTFQYDAHVDSINHIPLRDQPRLQGQECETYFFVYEQGKLISKAMALGLDLRKKQYCAMQGIENLCIGARD